MKHRVVVTGLGAVTPLGLDVPTTWEAMIAGRSGVDYITLFDASDFAVQIAAEVKNFDPSQYLSRREVRRRDRFEHFAAVAAQEAVAHAGLEINDHNADQVGIIIGSAIGGLWTYEAQSHTLWTRGPRHLSPFAIPMIMVNGASGQLAIDLGVRGPNFAVVSACATGSDAIGQAFRILQRGDAQVMLAGGAEATVAPIGIGAFDRLGALSRRNDDPQSAPQPFDKERDGIVMGEGAAVLVLERLEHALERGATPLAELVGYGATADAYHIIAPAERGEGGAQAMRLALRDAGLRPEEVDYINAHGTATPLNDKAETEAIKTVFGEHAYRLAVSSTKSMTGHMMGATAAVEAMACVLALRDGVIPPTINYRTPDPECDLDYVPNQARRADLRVAMSNAFGFGGHNSVLIFKRWEA